MKDSIFKLSENVVTMQFAPVNSHDLQIILDKIEMELGLLSKNIGYPLAHKIHSQIVDEAYKQTGRNCDYILDKLKKLNKEFEIYGFIDIKNGV